MKVRRSQILPACLSLAALAVLVAIAGLLFSDRPDTQVWEGLGGVMLALCIPVGVAALSKRFEPFEPIYLVSVAYFLYFVYAPANDILHRNYEFFGRDMLTSLPSGSLYAALGVLSMMVGYYWYRGPLRSAARRLPVPDYSTTRVADYGWLLMAAATVCFGAYVSSSRLSWTHLLTLGQLGDTVEPAVEVAASPYRNYLKSTIECFVPAFMLLYVFGRTRRRSLWTLFAAILVVYITLGFRYRILIFVMAPVIFWHLKNQRRPRMGAIVIAAFLAVTTIGGIGMLRRSFRTGANVDISDLSFDRAQATFTSSLGIYQPFMGIVDAIPAEHPFFGWRPFTFLFVQPIPRVIWPDKPEPPIREILSVAFGEQVVETGIFYPNIGEFYAAFGVAGVIVGMLLFGAILRLLYEYLLANPRNDWAKLLFSVSLPFLVQVVSRGYFVQIIQEAAFLLGPILLTMWLVRRRAHRRSSSLTVMRQTAAELTSITTHRAIRK